MAAAGVFLGKGSLPPSTLNGGSSMEERGQWRPVVWMSMRLAVVMGLLLAALGPIVSDAGKAAQSQSPAVALENAPPALDPQPPAAAEEPQAQTTRYVAEVTIQSADDIRKLQELGYSCTEADPCQIEVTEAELTTIQEAGLEVTVVAIAVQALPAEGPVVENHYYLSDFSDHDIPDFGYAAVHWDITSAPAGAKVTRVRYRFRVDMKSISLTGGPGDYVVLVEAPSASVSSIVWDRLGGSTDGGHDDDAATDDDIYLDRTITSTFDGLDPNQRWQLFVWDRDWNLSLGYIDYVEMWIYYCTVGPSPPALIQPANNSHICDTTPLFDWADVSVAVQQRMQVDDSSSFSSPELDRYTATSQYIPIIALAPGQHYWRVALRSECGWGAWSTPSTFYIDTAAGTPGSPSPAHGATGVSTDANLDWADCAGASSYDVYFGTSAPPTYAASVSASAYDLPTLSSSTDYYWKIVAKNSCGDKTGAVWHFTTGAGGTNHSPTNGTITPNRGGAPAGQMVYFTTTWSDPDGHADLKACRLHIGRWAAPKSLTGNAVFVFNPGNNKVRVRNDSGTRWWGGKAVGTDNVVQNSQAKVYCNQTTVSRSGNTITVRWAMEFNPAFRGRTRTGLKARDLAGLTSPLQQKGIWTVQ
jgi:hypothetical protein